MGNHLRLVIVLVLSVAVLVRDREIAAIGFEYNYGKNEYDDEYVREVVQNC